MNRVLESARTGWLGAKENAVPGLVIPVWFEIEKVGTYDLVCAELCGWGHYKMKGRFVVESPDEFASYLERLKKTQFERSYDQGTPSEKSTAPGEAPAVAAQ